MNDPRTRTPARGIPATDASFPLAVQALDVATRVGKSVKFWLGAIAALCIASASVAVWAASTNSAVQQVQAIKTAETADRDDIDILKAKMDLMISGEINLAKSLGAPPPTAPPGYRLVPIAPTMMPSP